MNQSIIKLLSNQKIKIWENGWKIEEKKEGSYTDWYNAENGNKEKQRWQIGAFFAQRPGSNSKILVT